MYVHVKIKQNRLYSKDNIDEQVNYEMLKIDSEWNSNDISSPQ